MLFPTKKGFSMSSVDRNDGMWRRVLALPEEYANLVCEYIGKEGIESIIGRYKEYEKNIAEIVSECFSNLSNDEPLNRYISHIVLRYGLEDDLRKIFLQCFSESFSANIYACHNDSAFVYLDFDGVFLPADYEFNCLMSGGYLQTHANPDIIEFARYKVENYFDQSAIDNFILLLQSRKIAVVVSSFWGTVVPLFDLRAMFPFGITFVDLTPKIAPLLRWDEISAHVSKNGIRKFVIVDDNDFGFPEDYFIRVTNSVFSAENREEIQKRLFS